MALTVAVVEENVADEFVVALVKVMRDLKIGPAYDKSSRLRPLG